MIKLNRDRVQKIIQRIDNKAWLVFLGSLLFSILLFLLLLTANSFAAYHSFSLFSRIGAWPILLNSLVIFAVLSLLFASTNRWLFSAGLTLFGAAAIFAINIYRYRSLGGPLVPSDIYVIHQGLQMLPVLFTFAGWPMLIFAAAIPAAGAILYFAWRARHPSLPAWKRTAILACGLVVPGWLLAYGHNPWEEHARYNPISEILWDKTENYEKNGLFVMLTVDTARLLRPVDTPAGYSPRAIQEIARKSRPGANPPAQPDPVASGDPVNVIVFLAESFIDPTVLPIQITADPVPFFHSLPAQGGKVGTFHVPTFGGITTRTEFEVLTGLSMGYLPEVVDPYAGDLNLNRQLPALPRFFKQHHYHTFAIHAFETPLSECRKVYKMLGFEDYYTARDFKEVKYRGPFISDETVVDAITHLGDLYSAKHEPFFILADSMQTHGAYDVSRGKDEALDVTTPLTPESHTILKTYVNAVSKLDEAWRKLIEHYRGSKQKTLIVIFGDHNPPMGDDFAVYKELKYYTHPSTDEEEIRIHTTPLAFWANFKLPEGDLPKRASTVYSYVIKAAHLSMEPYGDFNEYVARESGPATISSEADRDYQMIQYDLLFGKSYMLDYIYGPKEARAKVPQIPIPH